MDTTRQPPDPLLEQVRQALSSTRWRDGVRQDDIHRVVSDLVSDFSALHRDLRRHAGAGRSGSAARRQKIEVLARDFVERERAEALLRLCGLPVYGKTAVAEVRMVEDDLLLCLFGLWRLLAPPRGRFREGYLYQVLPLLMSAAHIANSRSFTWTGDAIWRRLKLRGGTRAADLAASVTLSRDEHPHRFRPTLIVEAPVALAPGHEGSSSSGIRWHVAMLASDARPRRRRVEFPGFSGHPITVASEWPRTSQDSSRPDDCDGVCDCRTTRCSRSRRSERALGSCRCAS